MKEISGNTRLFGILADPIYHVKTPQRMNEHFARIGFDGVCVPFHARPDNWPRWWPDCGGWRTWAA